MCSTRLPVFQYTIRLYWQKIGIIKACLRGPTLCTFLKSGSFHVKSTNKIAICTPHPFGFKKNSTHKLHAKIRKKLENFSRTSQNLTEILNYKFVTEEDCEKTALSTKFGLSYLGQENELFFDFLSTNGQKKSKSFFIEATCSMAR